MQEGLTLRAERTIFVNRVRSFGDLYLICNVALAARCISSVGLSVFELSTLMPTLRSRFVTNSGQKGTAPDRCSGAQKGNKSPLIVGRDQVRKKILPRIRH
jgi:hypothetical protein